MTHIQDPEYATPMDEVMARHDGYVPDGCYGKWVFLYQGKTYTAHAFNEGDALMKIAAMLGLCFDNLNWAEWEVLSRPVSAWESEG